MSVKMKYWSTKKIDFAPDIFAFVLYANCDVTAMSQVLGLGSHVVALPTVGGVANSRWHCQHLLANQVI
jgi:hypothetical protein